MKTRDQRAISVALVALGVLGLCLSGFGVMPHLPGWCWLVVLGFGVVAHVAVEERVEKARIARRFLRRLDELEQAASHDRITLGGEVAAERQRLGEYLEKWGPAHQTNRDEAIRRLNAAVTPLVDAYNSGKLTGQIKSVLSGKQS